MVGEGTTLVNIVNTAGVYYLAGLAVAIGFQMNLFNIGVEGQYRFAAVWAAIAGGAVRLPPVIHAVVIILVAILGSGCMQLADESGKTVVRVHRQPLRVLAL